MDIDFVITWVDGSDEDWQMDFRRCASSLVGGEDVQLGRYRDWGMLPFWFRAVEENCPWVRNIYFVTSNPAPDWLDWDNPKLRYVHHRDFIPKEWLPTFASRAIEANLFRIEGLSEHFVYFNDDMFVNRPLSPGFFFDDRGYPILNAVEEPVIARECTAFDHSKLVCASALNRNFQKQGRSFSRSKAFYSLKDPWGLMKTAACRLFWPNGYLGFKSDHLAMPLRVSTIEDIWDKEPVLMQRTSAHRFRNCADANPLIFLWWELAQGTFEVNNKRGTVIGLKPDTLEKTKSLLSGEAGLVCLNDTCPDVDFEQTRDAMLSILQEKFPHKSSFER